MSTTSSIRLSLNFQGIDFQRGVKVVEIIAASGSNLITTDVIVYSKDALFEQLSMLMSVIDMDDIAHSEAGGNQFTTFDISATPFLSCMKIAMVDNNQQFIIMPDGRLPTPASGTSYSQIVNSEHHNYAILSKDTAMGDRIRVIVNNKVIFFGNIYDTGLLVEPNEDADGKPMINIGGDYYDFTTVVGLDVILNHMPQTAFYSGWIQDGDVTATIYLKTIGSPVNNVIITSAPDYLSETLPEEDPGEDE